MINQELVDALAARTQLSRAQVLQSFRDSLHLDRASLRAAANDGGWATVAQRAHGLRGACEMLGARTAAEACRALEGAAAQGGSARVQQALAALETELEALDASLEQQDDDGHSR